jgi:hypothetical protein
LWAKKFTVWCKPRTEEDLVADQSVHRQRVQDPDKEVLRWAAQSALVRFDGLRRNTRQPGKRRPRNTDASSRPE